MYVLSPYTFFMTSTSSLSFSPSPNLPSDPSVPAHGLFFFEALPAEIVIQILDKLLPQELIDCYDRDHDLLIWSGLRDQAFWRSRLVRDFGLIYDTPANQTGIQVFTEHIHRDFEFTVHRYFAAYESWKMYLHNDFERIVCEPKLIVHILSDLPRIPPNDKFFQSPEITIFLINHINNSSYRHLTDDVRKLIYYLLDHHSVRPTKTLRLDLIMTPMFEKWLIRHQKQGTNMKLFKCKLINEIMEHKSYVIDPLIDIVSSSLLDDLPDLIHYDEEGTIPAIGKFFVVMFKLVYSRGTFGTLFIKALNTIPYNERHEVMVWYFNHLLAGQTKIVEGSKLAGEINDFLFHPELELIDTTKICSTKSTTFQAHFKWLLYPIFEKYNKRYGIVGRNKKN